ncbi:unnamed protein product [Thlaspi arvense]|uniref:Uncharacterized protein n=1 Tax=Thlaspi arvense TaxID=13288 RepID=A0AAU9SXT6_THLAR|nr:unnamed protein product [Thlaspi arvense]
MSGNGAISIMISNLFRESLFLEEVYSMLQGKRDVDTVLTMGIMEDVSIVPQPAGDTGKVDLTMNVVERVSGGFSAGGGISSGYDNKWPSIWIDWKFFGSISNFMLIGKETTYLPLPDEKN